MYWLLANKNLGLQWSYLVVKYQNENMMKLWLINSLCMAYILYITIVHSLMYFSNKRQMFYTFEQWAGGIKGSVITETCKQ